MKHLLVGVIGLFLLIGFGCRSTKKIQTVIAKKDTVQTVAMSPENAKADSIRFIHDALSRINQRKIDFRTFSAKVKVDYEGSDGKSYDFTAFIRMQKDSVIWISINAILGIEAFRVLITHDSVKLFNKLDKVVELRSVNYLQEVIHLPLDFKTLQDLIIGNPVYLDSNIIYYRKDDRGISLVSSGDFFRHYLTVDKNNYTLQHSKLDDLDELRARTCDLTYGEYGMINSIDFSTYRKISVAEKSKLDIELDFKQINFNESLGFPFSVPKNYKSK